MRLHLADETATNRLGEDIAIILAAGDVLALHGDLGMGKSTLARAIIRAIANDPALEVPSPTFTLVQAYATRVPVQHFDLYRLGSPEELEELGFDEAIRDGAALIEWPERAEDYMPQDAVHFHLEEDGAGRTVSILGPAAFLDRLARSLAIRAFLDEAGYQSARRAFLVGDASARAYESIDQEGRDTIILMNSPRRPDGPPIRDGLPYSRIAHLAEDVIPFVAIAKVLREEGFAAPQIPAVDFDRGFMLVEHLGSEGVLDAEGTPIAERYIASAQLLARMHQRNWPTTIPVAEGIVHEIPSYDRRALGIETELVTDWYLPHIVGRQATEAEREELTASWNTAFDALETAEKSIVLRDYHSPNLIWRGDLEGHDRVGLIDFQDAVIGPSAYDVASLAQDARVTISPELEAQVLDAYVRARGEGFDRAGFKAAYAIMAAQRNSKILGIFVRLNVRDGKPGYMQHLPRIRDYVSRSIHHPALAEVRKFYEKAGIL
ncbi:tRNA (adenosine(37)-N6)-threonylcarbamoyltransferase complex ATPase subunit type 1 TsaE [Aquamicrobium zhengzhouense]|uniref:tRNA threonylcarbamoyladenosine biosynthesis protein TsaE n=1 Tax=Aquamicrobium zhengzhouense TaxID=2781738 RepID=A0ABS0SHP3_9HYPH|nr:tRNA (adenosine(37)-N6)-threonylcarbamoyltransferase complex ATPase subunit type 1 TsaE [Aquamicrobium zhengzhouense]MBI1622830.1 tRNA (adenosine(37)-N6)-threonylcarbamoyltransferase complex ATPase subunit type 1 TsaE [Aquamicrobium zhengzhouense]